MENEDILDNLYETDCKGCGGIKKQRMSFCGRCYHKLPPETKTTLYTPIPEYYDIFRDALTQLQNFN